MRERSNIALSIIVPCYKVEEYLPKCLDSLMSQTLSNIEIICINDGSPDHCIDILRDYENRFPGKIVVIDKQNEGVWKGRWDGIATFAEALYTAAKSNDADIAVCGFDRIDLKTGKLLSREMARERAPFTIDDDPGRLIELNGAPWNKCFKASVLKQMHNLTNPPTVLDDLAFHLLAYCELHGKVVFVPGSYIRYMVRAGSIINNVKRCQVESVYAAFLEIRQYYRNERPELLSVLDALAFLHLGISLVFRLSSAPGENVKADIQEITKYLDGEFPSWRCSPYINCSYALSRGSALRKLLIVQIIYKLHLIRPFLSAYSFVIEKLHIDIKW